MEKALPPSSDQERYCPQNVRVLKGKLFLITQNLPLTRSCACKVTFVLFHQTNQQENHFIQSRFFFKVTLL